MAGIDDELDKELEKLFRENLLNVPYTTKRVIKKIKTMILKAQAEARLGMVEYYDQVSNNKDMDWKGLFADNRKLIEQERKALLITQQTQEAFKKGRIDAYGYALGRLEKPFLDGSERLHEVTELLELGLHLLNEAIKKIREEL